MCEITSPEPLKNLHTSCKDLVEIEINDSFRSHLIRSTFKKTTVTKAL